jgi:hypothetical protein
VWPFVAETGRAAKTEKVRREIPLCVPVLGYAEGANAKEKNKC